MEERQYQQIGERKKDNLLRLTLLLGLSRLKEKRVKRAKAANAPVEMNTCETLVADALFCGSRWR